MDPRTERFLNAVVSRGGFSSPEGAKPAISAVLAAIGERLSDDDLASLKSDIPAAVLVYFDREAQTAKPDFDFVADVAVAEGISTGFAREHANVVLTSLEPLLSPDGQRILRDALPAGFDSLFDVREDTGSMPPRHDRQNTFATGKPGSEHPVSEFGDDPAQPESVARSANPHANTKISSSEGMTQEREAETLADGKPPD